MTYPGMSERSDPKNIMYFKNEWCLLSMTYPGMSERSDPKGIMYFNGIFLGVNNLGVFVSD